MRTLSMEEKKRKESSARHRLSIEAIAVRLYTYDWNILEVAVQEVGCMTALGKFVNMLDGWDGYQ